MYIINVSNRYTKELCVKIVRAMKERARLIGEIKDLKHRLQNCTSTIVMNEFHEDFTELHNQLVDRIAKANRLKDAIMQVNVTNGMNRYITQLGELKEYLQFLKELNPKNGIQQDRYADSSEPYKSQITLKEKNDAIQATQNEINRITDLLDDFNAKTNIGEIEEVALLLPSIRK